MGDSTTEADATLRAFTWKNGQMTNLGSLNGDTDICSLAFGSNSKGQIVGNSIADCDIDPSRPFLWEDGGPMVDLNSLIPPGSGLVLREGAFINDAGEIAGVADLPNGDQHAFLLIPEGHDDDLAEGAADTGQNDVVPVVRSSARVTRATLTPGQLAQVRARFANRYRRAGIELPKRAN